MKRILRTVHDTLKDNRATSTFIPLLAGLIILLIIISVAAGFFTQIQKSQELDHFAEELALRAGQTGRCAGSEINERYEQLATASGLRPVAVITSNEYFDSTTKTVQYGDAITVHLTLESKFLGFEHFYIPITLEATKVTQSMQYWK